MKPLERTIRYFPCPICNKDEFRVDHLKNTGKPQPFKWNCSTCGRTTSFVYMDGDIQDVKDAGDCVPKLVLLELRPEDLKKTLRLLVKGYRHHRSDGDYSDDAYYYEGHTCPTNYLRDVQKVYLGDDDDPHGLFRFVRSFVPVNAWDRDVVEAVSDKLVEAFADEGSIPIDTVAVTDVGLLTHGDVAP
jgi:hypothetical protein